jgi:hypothetical protein
LRPISATKNVGLVWKSGLFNHTKRKSQEKNKKKINPRHRRVFNRLPEGEEWALKVIFHPNKLKGRSSEY